MLLGNKADMASEKVIRTEDGERLANVRNVLHLVLIAFLMYFVLIWNFCIYNDKNISNGWEEVYVSYIIYNVVGTYLRFGLPQEYNVAFMETSAKTGMNVDLAFMAVARLVESKYNKICKLFRRKLIGCLYIV